MNSKHNRQKHNSQAGFMSLELLALVIFLLFLTGIGQALWQHSLKMGDYCRDVAQKVGFYDLTPTCTSLTMTMMDAKYHVEKILGVAGYAEGMNQDDLLHEMNDFFSLSLVGLDAQKLKHYINPAMLQTSVADIGNSLKQAQFAVTQGTMGSNLFAKGNVGGGLDYMRNAASVGDYGVMSQLQLGSIYGGGLNGVPQDLGAANYYHSQAYHSLQRLQQSGAPAAQQILSTLPVNPQQLMQQLAQVVKVK